MSARRHLTLITAPAIEPVTVSELAAFARLDDDAASAEEALIDSFITVARQAAEEYTRRAFITQSWKLSLDLNRCGMVYDLPEGVYDLPVTALYGELPDEIELPRAPVQSITSVTTYDTANTASTFDPSNYTADTAGNRIVLAETATWPTNLRSVAAVAIVTINGYGDAASDVPPAIRMAIQMHAASLYETRGQCGCDVPPAAQQLLRQYRVECL
ncbi:head-tail connector protein [Tautonia plasticadhaerens]|uniref:Phage gp6-like head-tail connector protein n=1 Tax=Tautonia plasticadhaerens TaxID=2527974 RepID=A0A518H267_9BACT|nr:hypothetical protein [Tautonia plasticadhaerens]QDV34914.1 hypothetical protein ElP_28110 [Tautonia plasticadhaerens]